MRFESPPLLLLHLVPNLYSSLEDVIHPHKDDFKPGGNRLPDERRRAPTNGR